MGVEELKFRQQSLPERDEHGTSAPKQADADSVSSFERALNTGRGNRDAADQGFGQGGGFSQDNGQSSAEDLSSIFSSLMMGGQSAQPQNTAAITPDVQPGTISDQNALQDLADSLVDKILVSDPKYSQGSEIRLTLSAQSGLEGSEIVLRRDLQGLLAVEINCRRQDHFKKFVQLRPLLVDGLQRHESSEIRFILNDPEEEQTEDFSSSDRWPQF